MIDIAGDRRGKSREGAKQHQDGEGESPTCHERVVTRESVCFNAMI